MWDDFNPKLHRYGEGIFGDPLLAGFYDFCETFAKSHYENFTVASRFLPKRLKPHFYAVYAFCRWSDDLADESGDSETSLNYLQLWRMQFNGEELCSPPSPILMALDETIRQFHIPHKLFLNLLDAFEQDQTVKEYDTFEQLLGYCANSANPVGQIVLHLFESYDDERAKLSDEICTGLQLANFWQDVARDLAIGRIYLPKEDRERFGVSDLFQPTPQFRELLKFQVDRTRGFFVRGKPLLKMVPREFRIDLDLFVRGGEAILHAIEKQNYDVLTSRPRLGRWAKFKLLLRAVRALV